MIEGAGWVEEFPASIVVTDSDGTVVSMNARAVETFASNGGAALIGSDVRDCHPEGARRKVEVLFETRKPNVYTIEKDGRRKLIYQSPWFRDGEFAGFVELSLPLPDDMPSYVRGVSRG